MRSLTLTTCDYGNAHPTLKQHWWKWDRAPNEVVVGWLDNEPIAIARLFEVRLMMPGVTIEAVGIGGVFVAEEYRGQSYGKQVVQSVVVTRGRLGRPFVLRSRDGRMYQRLGFEKLCNDQTDDQGIYCLSCGIVAITPHVSWQLNRRF